MAKIYLVRHGHAAAGFDTAVDPGLDDLGQRQADTVAARLAPLGPLNVTTSPLRRTRETAAPLERRWQVSASVEPAVAEIPSPTRDLAARGEWLKHLMAGTWEGVAPDLAPWREGVAQALLGLTEDTVVFSHFIAINAAVGWATKDPRVVVFRPDNCSCTLFETGGGHLRLVQLGDEAGTEVL